MCTPNLALAHIAASQTQKEVTANAAFDALDTAITDQQSINCAGAADVTPSSTIVDAMVLLLTGLLTGSINLKLPAVKRPYIVRNTTTGAFTITVKTVAGGSTGVIVPQGTVAWVYSDGTNVLTVASGAGSIVDTAHGGTGVDLSAAGSATSFLAENGSHVVSARVIAVGDLPALTRSISYIIDGGGAVPVTGIYGQLNIPVACTVTGWVVTGDVAGACVVDVLRSTYANFPTTASIAGTDKPTIVATNQKAENLGPLSNWGSTALVAGDQLQFNLNSVATITRINITLIVTIP